MRGASSATSSDPASRFGESLDEAFYDRPPREVARDLIGCGLFHDGVGGTIVETEAYERDDPACHAYVGRTARSDVIYGPPGTAYVYLCYGIHRMFNVVTEPDGIAAAVLVRALEPQVGLEVMEERRGPPRATRALCSGPGKLCEALGIELGESRSRLSARPWELTARPAGTAEPPIATGPRIGITKGVELPWRYCLEGSAYLSRPAG